MIVPINYDTKRNFTKVGEQSDSFLPSLPAFSKYRENDL